MSDVTDAFALLSEVLGTEVENLNSAGAALFVESRHAEAEKLGKRGRLLKTFLEKVRKLETEWARDFAEEQGTAPDTAHGEDSRGKHPGPMKWRIVFGDGTCLTARTGAETLKKFFEHLVTTDMADPADLAGVIPGRSRPLIARTPEKLYPGRPDLASYSREFVPGWFVGTNWSHRDVKRLLRTATKTIGLVWDKDVRVEQQEQQKVARPLDTENDATIACIGDSLRLRKIDGSREELRVTLSGKENRPEEGIVSIDRPLGAALEGARENDEIEYQVGSYMRNVHVLAVEKARK